MRSTGVPPVEHRPNAGPLAWRTLASSVEPPVCAAMQWSQTDRTTLQDHGEIAPTARAASFAGAAGHDGRLEVTTAEERASTMRPDAGQGRRRWVGVFAAPAGSHRPEPSPRAIPSSHPLEPSRRRPRYIKANGRS